MKYAVINNQHCLVLTDKEITTLMEACAIVGKGPRLAGKMQPITDLWDIFSDPDSATYDLYHKIIYGEGLK